MADTTETSCVEEGPTYCSLNYLCVEMILAKRDWDKNVLTTVLRLWMNYGGNIILRRGCGFVETNFLLFGDELQKNLFPAGWEGDNVV